MLNQYALSSTAGILLAALFTARPCVAQVCPNLRFTQTATPIGWGPWCATSGDLNGDGAPDLLFGRSPMASAGGLSLLVNSGHGTFPSAMNLHGCVSPRCVALGDMDGDGDPDIVLSDEGILATSNFYGDGIVVLANNGLGQFTAKPLTAFDPSDDEPEGLALGDLDGDGDLDVVVAVQYHTTRLGGAESHVLVALNDGEGNLSIAGSFPTGWLPGNLVCADFDGDGALDVATICSGANGVVVMRGHGDGALDSPGTSYVVGTNAEGLALGDFDGDGDMDLIAGGKYSLRMLVNLGDGTFTAGQNLFFGYYNQSLVACDFNQDGRLDLIGTFLGTLDAQFLAGDGAGSFTTVRNLYCGTQVKALTVGDWNGDGMLDVATADSDGIDVLTWRSECGTWTYCTAKTNSLGCTPQIGFSGVPSASAGAGFTVTASNLHNHVNGMLFYGINGRADTPFGGGTMCVAGPRMRTPILNSGGSSTGADCSGAITFPFNAWIQRGIDPMLLVGTRVDAQFYTRDAGFPAPNNIGLSDAVEFTIGP